jgi:hypothetical protein
MQRFEEKEGNARRRREETTSDDAAVFGMLASEVLRMWTRGEKCSVSVAQVGRRERQARVVL